MDDRFAMLRSVVKHVGVGSLMVEVSTIRQLLHVEQQARETALRQPGAEYRRALEDAASLAETIPPRDIGDRLFDAHVLTGARIATAIRALASDD